MATTPPPIPESTVKQSYQPPSGAIPIEKIKRTAIALGVVVLIVFAAWGSFHITPQPPASKTPAGQVQPTTPAEVDSQQAELNRELQEASRAAQQAELAKERAMHATEGGPRNSQAQVDPETQLRLQLRLEDLRRQHQAVFATTVAFAPQGEQGEAAAAGLAAASTSVPEAQRPASVQPQAGTAAGVLSVAAEVPPAESPLGTFRLDEGTIIESILLNRLDGEFVGPVIAQVSTDVYSRAGIELLIPRGSRLLGEARDVNSFDRRRLAIVFHRLILPNGKSLSLDKFRGLDQIGETGVVSKVDHHYLEIFGTSLALGAIAGLTQIGNYGGAGYDPAVGFRVGLTERTGASAEQVLSKFLNKFPTIKVLEGNRIKIILTNDLNVEAY